MMQIAISVLVTALAAEPRVREHMLDVTICHARGRIVRIEIALVVRIHIHYAVIRLITIRVPERFPCVVLSAAVRITFRVMRPRHLSQLGFQKRIAQSFHRRIIIRIKRIYSAATTIIARIGRIIGGH